MIIKGNWLIPEPSDPAPLALLRPSMSANLCLKCGVRIWTEDMHIHEAWHDQMGV